MNKIYLIITLVLCVIIIPSNDVSACKCMNPGSPTEKLNQHSAVFLGKVVDIDKVLFKRNYEVEFKVEKSWKGVVQNKVKIYTARDSATCGDNFEKNKRYIVYAEYGENGLLSTSSCSGNIGSSDIVKEEEQLGQNTIVLQEKKDIMTNPYVAGLIIIGVLFLFSLSYYFLVYKRHS